jgi:hypothetical protein
LIFGRSPLAVQSVMLLIASTTDSRVKFLPAALMPATSSAPFCQPASACSVGA